MGARDWVRKSYRIGGPGLNAGAFSFACLCVMPCASRVAFVWPLVSFSVRFPVSQRRQPLQLEAQVIDAEAENVQQQVDDDRIDEDAIASEFGTADGDTVFLIKTHKYTPNSKEMVFCSDFNMADLPLAPKLQEAWGAGKYRIQIFKNGKYARRYNVSVAEAPKWKKPEASTAPPANDPAVMLLLREMIEAQKAAKPEPQQVFTFQNALALVTAAGPALLVLKELIPKRSDPITQLKTLLEIQNQLKPEDALPVREPSVLEVISNVLTKTNLLETLGGLGAAQPQQPQPGAPQITHQQLVTPEQQQSILLGQVKAQLAGLVECAKKSKDPALYAEVVIDQLSDVAPEMVRQLAMPGAIDTIITLHPPCATYRPWFEALLTSIAEQLSEDVSTETESAAPVPAPSAPAHQTNFDPLG